VSLGLWCAVVVARSTRHPLRCPLEGNHGSLSGERKKKTVAGECGRRQESEEEGPGTRSLLGRRAYPAPPALSHPARTIPIIAGDARICCGLLGGRSIGRCGSGMAGRGTARMGLAIGSRPYAVERDPERDPPPVVESSCRAYPHSPNTSRVLFTAAHVQARAVRGGAGGGGAAHHVRRRHGPPIDN